VQLDDPEIAAEIDKQSTRLETGVASMKRAVKSVERIPPHRLQEYRAGVAFHSRGTALKTFRDGALNETSRKYSSTSESSSPHSWIRSSLN
jgi:hypothetical protein